MICVYAQESFIIICTALPMQSTANRTEVAARLPLQDYFTAQQEMFKINSPVWAEDSGEAKAFAAREGCVLAHIQTRSDAAHRRLRARVALRDRAEVAHVGVSRRAPVLGHSSPFVVMHTGEPRVASPPRRPIRPVKFGASLLGCLQSEFRSLEMEAACSLANSRDEDDAVPAHMPIDNLATDYKSLLMVSTASPEPSATCVSAGGEGSVRKPPALFRVGGHVLTEDGFFAKIVSMSGGAADGEDPAVLLLDLDVVGISLREGVPASMVAPSDRRSVPASVRRCRSWPATPPPNASKEQLPATSTDGAAGADLDVSIEEETEVGAAGTRDEQQKANKQHAPNASLWGAPSNELTAICELADVAAFEHLPVDSCGLTMWPSSLRPSVLLRKSKSGACASCAQFESDSSCDSDKDSDIDDDADAWGFNNLNKRKARGTRCDRWQH